MMNNNFEEYLERIVFVSDPIYEKIDDIYDLWMNLDSGLEIEDIFVSEYVDKKGIKEYQGVYFFTKEFILATEGFGKEYALLLMPLINSITNIDMRLDSYDFNRARPNSSMSLTANMDVSNYFELRATHKNCDHLKKIFVKYIKPNVKLNSLTE